MSTPAEFHNFKQEITSLKGAIVALQLCQVSYDPDITSIPTYTQMVRSIPNFPGSWSCPDDAVVSGDGANLIFVAAYSLADTVLAYAVVIRGTDTAVGFEDLWQQVVEDLDIAQSAPPWSGVPNTAQISNGALDTYNTIMVGTDAVPPFQFGPNNQSLNQYMQTLLTDNQYGNGAYPPILLIGHSLGGCQVSVLGPSLNQYLVGEGINTTMIPITFAAPTAGNSAYADYVTNMFPTNRRYFNSLDVIPNLWWNLISVEFIYDNCAIDNSGYPDFYEWLAGAIATAIAAIGYYNASYSQIGNGNPLNGTCMASSGGQAPAWPSEGLHQHHTTTYMALLGGTNVPIPNASTASANKEGKTGGVGTEL